MEPIIQLLGPIILIGGIGGVVIIVLACVIASHIGRGDSSLIVAGVLFLLGGAVAILGYMQARRIPTEYGVSTSDLATLAAVVAIGFIVVGFFMPLVGVFRRHV